LVSGAVISARIIDRHTRVGDTEEPVGALGEGVALLGVDALCGGGVAYTASAADAVRTEVGGAAVRIVAKEGLETVAIVFAAGRVFTDFIEPIAQSAVAIEVVADVVGCRARLPVTDEPVQAGGRFRCIGAGWEVDASPSVV
jgi:hypothetical protein